MSDPPTPPAAGPWTRGRLLAYAIYALAVSAPGTAALLRGADAARRGTLERVNSEKAREVAALQVRVEALRRDLDRLSSASEARTERLRDEIRRTREELSRALLELASRRRVRPPLRRRLERADSERIELPEMPRPTRLPKLRRPTGSLEQVEAAAAAE